MLPLWRVPVKHEKKNKKPNKEECNKENEKWGKIGRCDRKVIHQQNDVIEHQWRHSYAANIATADSQYEPDDEGEKEGK